MLGHLLLEDLLQNCLNAFPDPGLYVAFHVMLELALRGQAPPSSLNPQLTRRYQLGEAHKDLHITSEEFDEVGAEIGRALDYFKVPGPEKQEVLGAIVARKAEVINPSR